MPDDQHPAQGLIDDIRGLFNGETFAKGIRDAWDRHTQATPAPAPAPQSPPRNWDAFVQADAENRAAQNKVTPVAAANIRAKANKALGK